MKRLILSSTIALVAGLFTAGLAISAGQHDQSQTDSKSQKSVTSGESDVGTASGASQKVQKEHEEIAMSKEQYREMQKLLNEQGFNPGPQDGMEGPKTRAALRQFQKSKGMAATGMADEDTIRALAPSTKEQEFFGLSPKFGGEEKKQ